MQTLCPESGFWTAPNWPKIRKMTISDKTSSSNFFDFVSLSKIHVNIITGSVIMTIFFYKGLTRNPEIGNTPVWVLANIWRLGWVRIPNFAQISPMKFYWILQKVTAFTVSELLRENQHGSPPTKIRVKPIVTVYRGMLKS